MTYLSAALLGLVQGICEFLPISSSGHLMLLQHIFHIEGADLTFDVLLHIGTLLPVLWMFRRDVRYVRRGIGGLIGMGYDRGRRTPRARENRRLGIFVLVASVPLLLGLLFQGAAKSLMERPAVVGILLLINGGILYLAGHSGRAEKPDKAISLLDVLLVGLAQIFRSSAGHFPFRRDHLRGADAGLFQGLRGQVLVPAADPGGAGGGDCGTVSGHYIGIRCGAFAHVFGGNAGVCGYGVFRHSTAAVDYKPGRDWRLCVLLLGRGDRGFAVQSDCLRRTDSAAVKLCSASPKGTCFAAQ